MWRLIASVPIYTLVLLALYFQTHLTKYEWQHLLAMPNPWFIYVFSTQQDGQFVSIPHTHATNGTGYVYLIHPGAFVYSYISLSMLKDDYPIEIWYHSDESQPEQLQHFDKFNPIFKDLKDYNLTTGLSKNFHFKAAAIFYSSFTKVVYLDTDAFLVDSITPLLSKGEVVGAFDYWYTPMRNGIYDMVGVAPNTRLDMEAGFMVLDKGSERVRQALGYALDMNKKHKITYQYLMGDKDTFRLAFLKYNVSIYWLDEPSSASPSPYHSRHNAMVHTHENQLLLVHGTLLKGAGQQTFDYYYKSSPYFVLWVGRFQPYECSCGMPFPKGFEDDFNRYFRVAADIFDK